MINKKNIKSIIIMGIDNENCAFNLKISLQYIYSMHIGGINSTISYVEWSSKGLTEQLSFSKLELCLYKNSNVEKLLNSFLFFSLTICLEDGTEILYDVPYEPANDESRTNILQKVYEENIAGKDIIRIMVEE